MRVSAACLLVLAALAAWTGAASAQPRQLPALAPAADDDLRRALTQGRLTEAQYALERARSLFRIGAVRREFGDVERPAGRDATLMLRDLAARLPLLSGQDRREAERLLARPTDNPDPQGYGYAVTEEPPLCGTDMCFHWVGSTPDMPPDDDGDPSTTPAQVLTTKTIFEEVWAEEIGLGYRKPLDDAGLPDEGPDGKLDIYLVDIGEDGIFGYCASDDPSGFATPVYCVVDNDYDVDEYGPAPPEPDGFLKVTAAHEFFHAVQGAYDFFEDFWFMEGTATNMEETVYPTIDDNVFFLGYSPLTRPRSPLDRGGFGDSEYGSWIFWRFLEEKVYRGNPAAISRIWDRAAWAFGPDDYSIQAVARVLRRDGRSLAHEFGRFGFVNRLRAYDDGSLYPRSTSTNGSFRMGSAKRTTGWQARVLNHLTTQYIAFRPRRGDVSRRAVLRVGVRVSRHGGRASLIVYRTNGTQAVPRIRLDAGGSGGRLVSFRRGDVRYVELVLSNGSSRMRDCFLDDFPPFYSCFGTPRDDRAPYSFRAVLRR